MPLPRRFLAAVAAALLGLGLTASARAADPATHTIAPTLTDPAIVDTTPTRGNHLVWLTAPERRVGKLLVFLPLGGANNIPTEFEEFGSEAGRLGYHTIVLAYRNEAPVAMAPPVGCGNGEAASTAPPNCAIDARMEILDGKGESTVVNVDRAGSIENRLNKLLVHLAATYAGEGWAQFIDTSGAEPAPRWSQTVIAGGSFGAGQAAIIAAQHDVHRAALFTGWTDARHGWVKLGATSPNRYSSLIHPREQFFTRTCFAYVELRLAPACPLAAFPVLPVSPTNPALVENRQPPFGTSQLVFNIDPTNNPPIADPNHPSALRDGYLAREADGTVSQKLINAWRSVLGDSDADGRLDHFASGTVGGSVPATLALTLGTPATFGAFTPGVARDYFASTTANVVSSAGDALLSVADPSSTATGHLVNGAFSLPQFLQARARNAANTGTAYNNVGSSASPLNLLTWSAPISNDAVTLEFKQSIGANDALRTGAYSKTLTFTLSTTTP